MAASKWLSVTRTKIPQVTWGVDFANVLKWGRPAGDVRAWSEPHRLTEVTVNNDRTRDGWVFGHRHLLAMTCYLIPPEDATLELHGFVQTGWDGPAGWEAFLRWCRGKDEVRVFPDSTLSRYYTCYLQEPMKGGVEHGQVPLYRQVRLTWRVTSFTTPVIEY